MSPEMVGLLAVAQHGVDRRLRHPSTISVQPDSIVLFCVDGEWTDDLAIDEHMCEPPTKAGWVRTTVRGRLPDTGVRVSVIWHERLHSTDA